MGILIAGVFGLALGFPSLSLSGHFLAIATIAFQTIVYLILTQWNSFTGGQFGIPVPAIGPATLFDIHTPRSFYYLTLAVTLLCVLIVWRLAASRLGTGWEAIREDELLARAIGLNTTRGKLIAFVASAAMAGAAGVLNSFHVEGVSPSDFSIWTSAIVVAMVVIGGRGTIFGPIVGAATLTLLPEVLRPMQDYRMILFGLLMILIVQFFPKGIWGLFGRPGLP